MSLAIKALQAEEPSTQSAAWQRQAPTRNRDKRYNNIGLLQEFYYCWRFFSVLRESDNY